MNFGLFKESGWRVYNVRIGWTKNGERQVTGRSAADGKRGSGRGDGAVGRQVAQAQFEAVNWHWDSIKSRVKPGMETSARVFVGSWNFEWNL